MLYIGVNCKDCIINQKNPDFTGVLYNAKDMKNMTAFIKKNVVEYHYISDIFLHPGRLIHELLLKVLKFSTNTIYMYFF
jgi:hypothetical protein